MTTAPVILWFRQDLRLSDHPALLAARELGPVIPVYIHAPDEAGRWSPGAAARWWLHHSLDSLGNDLDTRSLRLILRQGDSLEQLESLIAETGANSVLWSRCYEPLSIKRDTQIKRVLKTRGLHVESHNASLLYEPWTIQNQQGKPYQVFTQFWKNCLNATEPQAPLKTPRKFPEVTKWPESLELNDLELLPKLNWASEFSERWTPGESGAQRKLKKFLEGSLGRYKDSRNRPDERGSSRLSPHLHFGEISPRQIFEAVENSELRGHSNADASRTTFLAEIGWREFAHHLLYHFPETPVEPLRESFAEFPWKNHTAHLAAWQQGQTGFPIVDAGMRELWKTGWMHNRVRMIVASFLTKDLLIPWQRGAEWFWDTLVDADLANNSLGWQWTAGCGADASPFFRVFNPMSQGKKFDPDGTYVRRWVPELSALPEKFIHEPWEASDEILQEAGVRLGDNYPHPIVDHAEAREAALAAWQTIRK